MKPVVAAYISKSEVEAQVRFERFCAALDAVAEKVAAERADWEYRCGRLREFCHGSIWVALALVAAAIMANHWIGWVVLVCSLFCMWVIVATKLGDHGEARIRHEDRLCVLMRERDRVINHGPSLN